MKKRGLLQIILPAAACILSGCNASRNVPDVDWTLVPEEDAVTISDLAPYMEKIEIVRIADDDRLLFSDVSETGPDPVYRIDFKGKTIPERYYI